MTKIENFDRHVMLYAKGWYDKDLYDKNRNPHLSNLAKLLDVYTGSHNVGEEYVYRSVVHVFCTYVKPQDQERALSQIYNYHKVDPKSIMDTMVDLMIAQIGCVLTCGIYEMDIHNRLKV